MSSNTPYTQFGKNNRAGGAAGGQPQETDKLAATRQKVNEVQDVMRQNIDAVIARGDKIDDLQEKSAELEEQSVTFAKKSREVKRAMCWQSYKMLILMLFIIGVIIVILYFAISKGKG